MIRPSIKSYHEDRQRSFIQPIQDRAYFLGKNASELHKYPRVNIRRKGELFEMEVALPGFKKSEIFVNVADDILTISAERNKIEINENAEYVLKEFNEDRLERKFQLARNIGHEKITAKFMNGILTLTFVDVPEEEEQVYQSIKVL